MALFEGSYKSVLQGVSQQVPRERQDGQITAQTNMLSDPVTNLRRRPGSEVVAHLDFEDATTDNIRGFRTEIGMYRRRIVLNNTTGVVTLLNDDFSVDQTMDPNPYLIATQKKSIRWAAVGDELFFANTEIMPTKGSSTGLNPDQRGFFYVRAGALNKTYQVSITHAGGTSSGTYTTPDGTGAGDAADATPEYIAQQLVSDLGSISGLTISRTGAYVFILASATTPVLTVTSSSGDGYMIASGQSYVTQEEFLPPRLPSGADGYIVSTGSLALPTYYKYVSAKQAWLEAGDYASPGSLTNMPISIKRNSGDTAFEYSTEPYEGRLAGDDNSSPDPNFISRGITGLSSFQGRLVILSGPKVCMSASDKPRRWYRTTVTSLLDSDVIEAGAQANSSSAYEYAEQFQKDLLLFSEKYQALVPGLTTAITPRTASVVITSTYDADMNAPPVTLGRTLMYPAPRSADFFGMREMLPSTYTDSQYISSDVTAHIPKYMAGKCRLSVSSSVASMVLFGQSGDKYSLIVHEYLWDGDDKVQQAWHTWVFPFEVADAYFSGEQIVVMFVRNEVVLHATIDPRAGSLTSSGQVRPFLDLYFFATVVDNEVTLPDWLLTFDPDAKDKVRISNTDDSLAGEEVGVEDRSSNTLVTVRSFPDGDVAIGYSYRSGFVPTVPMVKDANGVKVSSNKLSILRFMIGTRQSAEFEVMVQDSTGMAGENQLASTLYWSSAELDLGNPRINGESTAIIPCRTAADTTVMEVYTDGMQELNVVSLEYACRYNQKYRRR